MAEATATPPQLERATLEFLRKYAPFNEMDADALRLLAGRAKLGYYPQGTVVVGPQSGVVDTLFIVQRGRVHSRPADATGAAVTFEYGPGEMFPLNALLGARASTGRYESAGPLLLRARPRDGRSAPRAERRLSALLHAAHGQPAAAGADGPAPRL
jgi:CBS domain-containing protein